MALTITLNSYTFEKQSAEVAFHQRALELLINELGRAKGTVTSGAIIGINPSGVANTSLGSWTYAPSGGKP